MDKHDNNDQVSAEKKKSKKQDCNCVQTTLGHDFNWNGLLKKCTWIRKYAKYGTEDFSWLIWLQLSSHMTVMPLRKRRMVSEANPRLSVKILW